MDISVVIPTHNRKASLRRCLEALYAATRTPQEIIVVNDHATDGTQEFLETQLSTVTVVYSSIPLGKSKARNRGILEAHGDIILFLDDDCVPAPHWIENMIRPFGDQRIDIVIGRIVYVREGYRSHFPERVVQNVKAEWPMTANIAYRKKVFQKIGNFDPEFDALCKEDVELAVRAVSQGIQVAHATDATVFHERSVWSARALLHSARNLSIWAILKKRYPESFNVFHPPLHGRWVSPHEYALLLLFPIIVLPLLIMYTKRGNRSLGLFFAKWPLFFILKRFYIYRESIRQRQCIL